MSSSLSYSTNTDRATLDFLNRFTKEEQEEGSRLQEDAKVSQIFGDHLAIHGRVETPSGQCRTLLKLRGDTWEGECSCENERCPALYATMLERRLRQGNIPESPNEIGSRSLAEILEEKLERTLDDREERFLGILEKRYRRFETEGKVFDDDLMRLHRKWEVKSYEPLDLWPEKPKNILEFWNYVAHALTKRGLRFPDFLQPITDPETTAQKLRDWERERTVEEWRERVDEIRFTTGGPPATPRQFRLMVTSAEARFQEREGGSGGRFHTLGDERHYQSMAEAWDAGALLLDGASQILWAALQEWWNNHDSLCVRLEHLAGARWLNRLFHQPLLYGRIVTLDEQPFARVRERLDWRCFDREEDYQLRLYLGDEPLPYSVRALPGETALYLTDEAVCLGPPVWIRGTEIEPYYTIPAPILQSPRGVAFLHHIEARLPPSLSERVVVKRLQVTVRVWLAKSGAGQELGFLRCEAADDQELRKELYQRGSWDLVKAPPESSERILHFDRRDLAEMPEIVDDISSSWDNQEQAYRIRIASTFPERFRDWAESLPDTVTLVLDDSLQSLLGDPLKAAISFTVEEAGIDWFDVRVQVKAEGQALDPKEVEALVKARGKFVRLHNGKWMRLRLDLDEEASDALNRIGLDPFDTSTAPHRMHVLQLADPSTEALLRSQDWEAIRHRAQDIKLQVRPKTPAALRLKLRPYQVEGFHFLAYLSSNRFGGILADDMGLGKTVQSLAWLLWLKEREEGEGDGPSLVVCPKSVVDVWENEVRKACPAFSCIVIRQKTDLDIETVVREKALLVINYAQLRILAEPLREIPWQAVVLDEGQQIKNPDSQAALAARSLKSGHRLVLTGTPLENRLLDIWSLMDFAMPGVLGDRKYFKKRFDRRKDPTCQQRLASRLRPFLLRRTKGQVALDLPPRIEEDILCRMEDEQAELYQAEVTRIREALLAMKTDAELRRNQFVVLQGLMRLRQICCHPALVMEDGGQKMPSAKLDALFYLLNQLQDEGHKSLVFSQFTSMLEIIRRRLESEGRPYQLLTGQTGNRSEIVDKFQHTRRPDCFLLSLKAGGTGLNLTAASYVILFDPWWNPAVENQAIDRTHRIGQTNSVIAYRLIMRGTVEEKIRKLQKDKSSMAEGVLGEEGFASGLRREDIEYLFSSDLG